MYSVIAVPALADNYIWLLHRDGFAVVVDPGESAPVEAALAGNGLRLQAILLTHHHPDHIAGAAALAMRHTVPIHAPIDERIADARRVSEGDRVPFDALGVDFGVMEIPGHTRSHIAFYDGARVYCGDTLFAAGCGRLFEGTPLQMFASLARLAALPDETEIYCGHEYTVANLDFALAVEPGQADIAARRTAAIALRARGLPTLPSRIDEERATNPFLRCGLPAVRAAVEAHAGHGLAEPVEVFAAMRKWKNHFKAN